MLEKHLIKATLQALYRSPYPFARGYIATLKECPTAEIALDILQELFDFYVDRFHPNSEYISEIIFGYNQGCIPKKYR